MTTLSQAFPGRNEHLAEIHGIVRYLGWDDELYRDFLYTHCRVRSAKWLYKFEREFILEKLREMANDYLEVRK